MDFRAGIALSVRADGDDLRLNVSVSTRTPERRGDRVGSLLVLSKTGLSARASDTSSTNCRGAKQELGITSPRETSAWQSIATWAKISAATLNASEKKPQPGLREFCECRLFP